MQALTASFVKLDKDDTGCLPVAAVKGVLADWGFDEGVANVICQSAGAMTPKRRNVRYKKLLEWINKGTKENADAQLTSAPEFENAVNVELSVASQHQVNESDVQSRGASSSKESQPQQSATPRSKNGTSENSGSQSPKESSSKQPGHSQDAKVMELEKNVIELQAAVADLQGKLTQLWESWQNGTLAGGHPQATAGGKASPRHSIDNSWQVPGDLPHDYDEALKLVGGQEAVESSRNASAELSQKYAVHTQIANLLPKDWSKRIAKSVKLNFQDDIAMPTSHSRAAFIVRGAGSTMFGGVVKPLFESRIRRQRSSSYWSAAAALAGNSSDSNFGRFMV